jgi:spore photoproduct lyase
MNSWTYYSETLDRIYWLPEVADDPVRATVEANLAAGGIDASVESLDLTGPEDLPEAHNTARTIVVRRGDPQDFTRCPGTHGHRCCNYLTMNVYVGCTLGCSYCIMQSYLRNRTLEVRIPHDEAVRRVRTLATENPGRLVRVGTGEVGDSLLYDPLFEISSSLVDALGDLPNLRFELKTKTDYVDHLRAPSVPGSFLVAFSVNPPSVISQEEGWAAPLAHRLSAAERGAARGFGLAFHFDPMIRTATWAQDYSSLAAKLGSLDTGAPEWVSLGTIRYPAALRPYVEARPYGIDEFVSSGDGKMRYLQSMRAEMYRTVKAAVRRALPTTPVYLCMESSAVWRDLQRRVPDPPGMLRSVMQPLPGAPGGPR